MRPPPSLRAGAWARERVSSGVAAVEEPEARGLDRPRPGPIGSGPLRAMEPGSPRSQRGFLEDAPTNIASDRGLEENDAPGTLPGAMPVEGRWAFSWHEGKEGYATRKGNPHEVTHKGNVSSVWQWIWGACGKHAD